MHHQTLDEFVVALTATTLQVHNGQICAFEGSRLQTLQPPHNAFTCRAGESGCPCKPTPEYMSIDEVLLLKTSGN
jgi:hypothetical protein